MRAVTTFLLSWMVLGNVASVRAGSFGFESLRGLIDERHVQSVEGLIAALPEDLRAHYTLVFSSRSLQEASFAAPRVILFGGDARLIVSFNGDASQRGYSQLETLEFDPTQSRFILREISFHGGEGVIGATFSSPNPPRCVACHDRPVRPIWDEPPTWPGVYGERYRQGLSEAETMGIQAFLKSQPNHPRYRYLIGAPAFASRDTFVPGGHANYNGGSIEPPNAQLSALLTTLNVWSIAFELASKPAFPAYRFVLLGVAAGCGPPSDFYPAPLRAAIAAQLKEFSRSSLTANRRQLQAKSVRLVSGGGVSDGDSSPLELTELRFLAETGLNVSTQHWTLALERGTYDFSAPGGVLTLQQALSELVGRSDETVHGLESYRSFDAGDRYCTYLLHKSRQALEAWYVLQGGPGRLLREDDLPSNRERAGSPLLLAECIKCHSSDIAPKLPFADPEALTARLDKGSYPRGRLLDEILFRLTPQAGAASMPRGLNISANEREELAEYFLTLAPRSGGE